MTERLQLVYDSLIRFVDGNALVHRYATRPMDYAGETYEGVLADDPTLGDAFKDGIAAGDTVTLQINSASASALRVVVGNLGLTGIAIVVRLIGTASTTAGTTSWEYAKTLTITNAKLTAEGVTITTQDIEDARLEALYPSRTWNAETFRDIIDTDAGMLIPYPLGTALKLRAACISSDDTALNYYYGVCEAPILTLPIIAVSTGSKTFTVAGDYTDRITAKTVVYANVSSANVGRFTVTGAVYSAPNTVVTVSEALSSATANGSLLVPPTVLSVYRDGRLVDPAEYTVEMTWPVTTQMLDPDFDNSPADWAASNSGTGTATLTGGVGRLVGDGTITNWARLVPGNTAIEAQRGAFYIATVTLVTTGKLRLSNFSVTPAGFAVVSGQGTHTALVRQVSTSGIRRIDPSNYNTGFSGTVDIDNLTLNTTHRVLMICFLAEQVSQQGARYAIECDVRGVDSRNAATEIARLLTEAGCTTDSTTFTAAATVANTNKMFADTGYGRTGRNGGNGEARTFRAWLYDLLRLARATNYRTVAGAYAIAQNNSGSLPAGIDASAGGRFVVSDFERGDRPQKITLLYRPSGPDPTRLEGKVEKTVSGGNTGKTETIELPAIRDHETADRLAEYLKKRAEYNAKCVVEWWDKTDALALGGLLVLTDTRVYSNPRNWLIDAINPFPGGARMGLVEYDSAIYGYTPGSLSPDPVSGYEPDYSQTPPAAPSALKITAGATMLSTGGTTLARVTVEAVPPSANWQSVMFSVIHNTTGEILRATGDDIGSGKRGTNIPNLRPGEVYQLKSYAINAFGIVGTTQGTFDATAIGGGGAATTFTSPGYATLPANVSSCTAAQGMGRLIKVNWPIVTTANLARYLLEKKVDAGAFAELARPAANTFTDTDVVIGSAYQYRVKAIDTHGNLSSSYATSGTVTPVSNVTGGPGTGDIGTDTVATGNRTGVTTVTKSVSQPRFDWWLSDSISHSMGKVPIAVIQSSFSRCIASVSARTTTTVTVAYAVCPTGTTASNPTTPHSHTIEYGAAAGATMTIGADLW